MLFRSLEMINGNKGKGDDFEIALDDLSKMTDQSAQKAYERAIESFKSAKNTTFAVTVFSILFSIALGYLLSLLISNPLKKVVDLVGDITKGDLTKTSDIDTKDEVGILAKSMNEMVLSLRNLMQGALHTSNQVAASSEELTASAEQTSERSEERRVGKECPV